MRTDYGFNPPAATDAEADAFGASASSFAGVSTQMLHKTRDASPECLAYVDRVEAARAEWIAGTKDRPITHSCDSTVRIRLFDGPWIYGVHRLPFHVVEANYDMGPAEELGERVWERRIEPIWETYGKLVEADDEEGCRKLASAIYEFLQMQGATDRLLCTAGREARERWESRDFTRHDIEVGQGTTLDSYAERLNLRRLKKGSPLHIDDRDCQDKTFKEVLMQHPETDVALRARIITAFEALEDAFNKHTNHTPTGPKGPPTSALPGVSVKSVKPL